MVKYNYEQENDTRESGGSWVGTLSGLLVGLLIGGLGGAVVMLLLAPRSGKRTRSKLQRQGHELVEQAAETMEDTMTQARLKTQQVTHDMRR